MRIEKILKLAPEIPLSKQIILNISFTQNLISEKLSEVLKPHDISIEQFNVLRILRGQKGKPMNMGAIQERMLAKTSNTTRLIDKLLIKKMVTRNICKSNRRKIEVSITPEGLQLLEKVDGLVENLEKELIYDFSEDEQKELIFLLEKLRKQYKSSVSK
ncbi:MAG: MarR family transcriptional regulator [Weeksellaceae bacterium]|nr:MarR family transcriptional regulator [Weeksellaceae bacterium]